MRDYKMPKTLRRIHSLFAAKETEMGKVLRMSDFRSALRGERKSVSSMEARSIYFCTHCNAEHFSLQAGGGVNCASCGAVMGNLQVQETSHIKLRH